ncbi:hypothetical protein OEZ85_012006 [Tetradesmus obliquus]|uniref:Cyclin-like domain-containing protein n=1 Tax=Tetradesmus obliquus TaxID=3088 RepID=A0ABY8TSD8_TETOB|nr:hypothetical protein OEZ85_012006 [Tetradesmus obliquus]
MPGGSSKYVCTVCGHVIDEVVLVSYGEYNENGREEQYGTHVAADDDGTRAAGMLSHQDGTARGMQGASSIPSTARILSSNMERLQAGLSFLELPLHVAKAAKQLLPLVVEANARAEPRRNTTAATVAATIYMAARELKHALPLGRAGAALSVYGIYVGKEYRRLMVLMQREYVPPALETLVVAAAAVVLPQYEPGMSGSLRSQPVVRKALEVAGLLGHAEAADGYSPAVAAAAILCMCLSEQYKDAKPSMYAYQVAALLQHDRNAVQQHIRRYDALLAGMLELLPFSTGGGGGGAGVEGVRHAGVLLKLHELARKAEKSQQGQGQIPQLQGSGQAGQQGQ